MQGSHHGYCHLDTNLAITGKRDPLLNWFHCAVCEAFSWLTIDVGGAQPFVGGAVHGLVGLESIKKVAEQLTQLCSSMVLLQVLLKKTAVSMADLLCVLYIGFKCIHLNYLLTQSLPISYTYAYLRF